MCDVYDVTYVTYMIYRAPRRPVNDRQGRRLEIFLVTYNVKIQYPMPKK